MHNWILSNILLFSKDLFICYIAEYVLNPLNHMTMEAVLLSKDTLEENLKTFSQQTVTSALKWFQDMFSIRKCNS